MSSLNKNTFGHSVLILIDKYPEFFAFVGVVLFLSIVLLTFSSCSRNKKEEKIQICEKIHDEYVKSQCFLAIVSRK